MRRKRATASMVGAVLGNAPYMTRADAMRRMVRDALGADPEFTGNIATEYGTANEPMALLDFQMEMGLKVDPAPFVRVEDVHRGEDAWAGASPDGFVSDGGLIEAKCPYGLRDAARPVAFKPIAEQPHYYDQVQFQLWVTGKSFEHFWQWNKNDSRDEIIKIDLDWLNDNLPRLRQFYAEFLDELANNADEYLAPKRILIDTPEAAKMVAEWDELTEQAERVKERKADLLAAMAEIAGGKDAEFAGRKLTLVEREGAISYAKAIKELAPNADLEKWRGKPSNFWQLR